MAEMIAVSLSAKVAASLSAPAALELSSLFAIRSGVAAAARELELLRAFLRFAESRRGIDALAATWIDQVRDAALELEDVADEYSYLSGRGFVRGCADLGAWFALSRRLRRARERLRELSLAKEGYGILPLPAVASAEGSSPVGCSATSISRKLTEDAEPRRTLVAVWGMGGVGKTTLVTNVYKEVAASSYFDCAAWVSISKSYTTEDLLRRVLKELQRDIHTGAPKSVEEMNYRSLVEALQGILSKKRYLVLLDDVWDADAWFAIRSAFVDNGTRSRIIITTRSQDVANLAKSTRIILLKPLPEKEAWCLFCNTTFREDADRECPQHLEHWALKILNKCSGLPLAIVSVGNLLALKEKSEFAWRNVHDRLVWDESTSHGIGQVSSILNLSIDDLPYHLKRCFLYCSIYPEDFFIKRKILIRMWVAEGFVEGKNHTAMEDVADDYLNQLAQRSLLQVVMKNEFGRAKRFQIHDLIRELILSRSAKDGHFVFSKCTATFESNRNFRHLIIDRCTMSNHPAPKMMRSLELIGVHEDNLIHLSSSISKMSHLIRLGIASRDSDVQLDLEPFSPPPLSLQKFTLTGRLTGGKLPSWLGQLNNLMQLQLHSSELKEDSIGLLSLLPRLFDLSLVDAYVEKSLTFAAGAFPVLRKLRLEALAYLAHIDFQKGSLLALEKLILCHCFELIKIPQGIENLMHLKNLELSHMPIELTEKVHERQE
ncbi:hypothetical protein HU200_032735 [Digitaria exilis]|uniref:Uncharacterized protein n=1 Tax=Digitaria exilis TaxID=1010633 RepID=A0A835ES57_9POAL|nr:hypothetical protein HU200_032735 [Digitaria exilis]